LKEYWGVKNGTNQHDRVRQNGGGKTTKDIADFIGEPKRNTERILKLHDLIPELQDLVSEGKLGTVSDIANTIGENERTDLVHNGRSFDDISEIIGESTTGTKRILKLAYMTKKNQRALAKGNFPPSDFFIKGTKQCEECGERVEVANNQTKYCEECAEKIKREKTRESVLRGLGERSVTLWDSF